ncbi:MAG: DUF998 domain-containing protein [Anaerolineales bacterium]|nr:DUF998 domain-containing protein [Anaerolineales bacterium]
MRNYVYAVIYILIALTVSHFLADDSYRWQVNSISQLGAQSYGKAWIIRLGFVGFGIIMLLTGISRIKMDITYWFREIPILIYGFAILLSGIFSAEPFVEGVSYSTQEAQLHGLFATVAGFALTLAILMFTFTDIPNSRRIGHFIALVLVTVFSLLFGVFSNFAGIMQRLLWFAGFAWLLYIGFNPIPSGTSGTNSRA